MDVTQVTADQRELAEELFALLLAVHAADHPDLPPPLWEPFLAGLRQPDPEMRTERWAARNGGRVVGGALVGLPEIDNRHLFQFELQVHPQHRRRGLGRALLAQVCQRAGREQRPTLVSVAQHPVPEGPPRDEAGARFLLAMGFTPALPLRQRRIELPAVDATAEQRLLADCLPHAAGYECLTWTGLTPDPLADGVAALVNRLNTDAPTGELEIGASTLDTARLHAEERASLDRGTHLVAAAARHLDTGAVAALTRIDVRPPGDHGAVHLTIVDPEHRGHRLGTIVKIEAHRLTRRSFPQLRYVYTGNADENAHMVAINDRLGYVAYQAATVYQRPLHPD